MAAYLIGSLDITDLAGFAEYARQVPAVIAQYGGRYVVRGGAAEMVEGDGPLHRQVVLEFPDMAALKTWYASPEYAPLLALRQRTARAKVIFVEGS
jgi:uncharacterized protein (DUF1330 family)